MAGRPHGAVHGGAMSRIDDAETAYACPHASDAGGSCSSRERAALANSVGSGDPPPATLRGMAPSVGTTAVTLFPSLPRHIGQNRGCPSTPKGRGCEVLAVLLKA